MEVIILIAQRKCSYPGEYGEECLACMSEYEYSDNSDYLEDALSLNRASGEFDAVELITLKVPDEEISRRLFPEREPVDVVVTPNKGPSDAPEDSVRELPSEPDDA